MTHLSVFGSINKIVHEEIFKIRSGSCPLPSTIRADHEISIRREIEAREPLMSIGIFPIFEVTVPEMIKPSRDVASALADRFMKWASPLKVVIAACAIEIKQFS